MCCGREEDGAAVLLSGGGNRSCSLLSWVRTIGGIVNGDRLSRGGTHPQLEAGRDLAAVWFKERRIDHRIVARLTGQGDQFGRVARHLCQDIVSCCEPVLLGDRRVLSGISPACRLADDGTLDRAIQVYPACRRVCVCERPIVEQVRVQAIGQRYIKSGFSSSASKRGRIRLGRPLYSSIPI